VELLNGVFSAAPAAEPRPSHPVEAPVEALGCPTENYREEDPTGDAPDDNRPRRRQVGQRPHENRTDDRAGKRNSGRG